jgi:hypothetical protein
MSFWRVKTSPSARSTSPNNGGFARALFLQGLSKLQATLWPLQDAEGPLFNHTDV